MNQALWREDVSDWFDAERPPRRDVRGGGEPANRLLRLLANAIQIVMGEVLPIDHVIQHGLASYRLRDGHQHLDRLVRTSSLGFERIDAENAGGGGIHREQLGGLANAQP